MMPLCAAGMPSDPMMAHNAPMYAKLEPWKTGTIPLVHKWNKSVPRPAVNNATAGDSPVISGTNTVEPNIASRCWTPNAYSRAPNLLIGMN